MAPTANNESKRELEMGVLVRKAATGQFEGHVAELDLEPFGWGTDPLGAIERIRGRFCHEDGSPWGPEVEIKVHTDEESGYPTKRFHMTIDAFYDTTRPEKFLREMGQYLIDIANRVERDVPFLGQGLQIDDEGEVAT